MSLALLLAVMKTAALRTGDERWDRAARYTLYVYRHSAGKVDLDEP